MPNADERQPFRPGDLAEYNPADLANLVRYCVQELMQRQPYPFPLPDQPFDGAGIYALFYDGDFPSYQHPAIRSGDGERPIYVGRARKTSSSGPRPLYRRLKEHQRSIEAATNLNVSDFSCRFLVLHPLWVSTVEDLLIAHYRTLWNDVLQGFGVHDPGGRRHTGEIPLWDVLHPGRSHQVEMARRGAPSKPVADVERLIRAYCATAPVDALPVTGAEVLASLASPADEGEPELGS